MGSAFKRVFKFCFAVFQNGQTSVLHIIIVFFLYYVTRFKIVSDKMGGKCVLGCIVERGV